MTGNIQWMICTFDIPCYLSRKPQVHSLFYPQHFANITCLQNPVLQVVTVFRCASPNFQDFSVLFLSMKEFRTLSLYSWTNNDSNIFKLKVSKNRILVAFMATPNCISVISFDWVHRAISSSPGLTSPSRMLILSVNGRPCPFKLCFE